MSTRRIAREIAVIMMPQLPRDKSKLEKMEFDTLLCKSIQLLVDYARQCLSEANAYIVKSYGELADIEIDHPDNTMRMADIKPVSLTSSQAKKHLELLELSIHLVSEALDIPEMILSTDTKLVELKCSGCGKKLNNLLKKPGSAEVKEFVQTLLFAFLDNKNLVDEIIQTIKTKWRIERMVSIDRDILRLAVTELFFVPETPVKVVINEAVELAHRFADERAAKFINGVLSDLHDLAINFRETGELPNMEKLTALSSMSNL